MFSPPSLVPRCLFPKFWINLKKKSNFSSDFTKEPLLHEVILVVSAGFFCLCICCCCCCRYWRRGSGRPGSRPSGVSRARSGEWRVIGAAEDESKESSEGGT